MVVGEGCRGVDLILSSKKKCRAYNCLSFQSLGGLGSFIMGKGLSIADVQFPRLMEIYTNLQFRSIIT